MKIHFVYAFTPGTGNNASPYCITNNLYNYLKERAEITYSKWDSHKVPNGDKDTIFIGHPHYNPNTIVQQVFRKNIPFKAKCSIHPFHHYRKDDNWPFDHIARKADRIFAICGPYWYDTMERTDFAHWKPKMTRLDMAVNADIFPHVKKSFNNPNERGIVYVGSSMPQKNLGLMVEIARRMQDVRFEWYGGSADHPLAKLSNVYVEGWQQLSRKKIKNICNRNDIFLNTSSSDANPTTLLEFGLASGLIPICTKTSGYHNDDHFVNIPHDPDKAVHIIREWLRKPQHVLMQRSLLNREECEAKYTWDRFCSTVWSEIMAIANCTN